MSGFLRRWAERKAAQEAPPLEPKPEADLAAPQAESLVAAQAEPELAPEEIAAQLAALPALEEIGPETDIRPFLQGFVPAALRKAAIRAAWAADPIISTHLDVARDYAWEFNAGDLPVGFSRSLGPDAVRRSLDALGEIGADPLESPAAGAPQPTEERPDTEPPQPASTQAADPRHAAGEPPAEHSPEPGATSQEPPASSLSLRPRHGSALPG